MSNRHPLADEIKKWADAPDEWQWQWWTKQDGPVSTEWRDCDVTQALSTPLLARLVRKRSFIPSEFLPEGWEVKRVNDDTYSVSTTEFHVHVWLQSQIDLSVALYQLLCHIDPEASDDPS